MRVASFLLLAVACQRAPKTDVSASNSAQPVSSAVAAVVSATPSKAWFEGAWQGAFQSELFRVELPVGSVKEWKQDDGKAASGAGKLSLQAAPDGSVTGSASGALGELSVAGHFDAERAALTLSSAQPDGFHGLILAAQTPEGLQGTLSASSADSLLVRRASVSLTRANQ